MKKKLLLALLICFCSRAFSQTVLLDEDRTRESADDYGQNLKKYSHFYLRLGFLAGKDYEGARIAYGSSVNVALGLREKFKIGSVYSLGFDIEAQYTDYKLKQEQGKILPDTIINNISGRLDYYSLGVGFYNRFNFDPGRGNFIGNYFDIGIMGLWDFSVREISKNKMPDGTKLKQVKRNLGYTNDIGARAYFRLSHSHLSFYGSYRFTDLFKSSYNYPDLPAIIIGLEMGLY